MKIVVCIVPVSSIRYAPDHRSEMTSQFLFGEIGKVLEEGKGGWLFIEHSWDGYKGWCRKNQFTYCKHLEFIAEYTGDWVDEIVINGKKLMIPFGSNLSLLKGDIPGVKAEFNGNIYSVHHAEINDKKITGVASMYLNTSYLWGGRSVFGIDCSGFVQSIYKMINVPIFRDAINQVNQGREISLEESQCSDLAFFEEDEKITHVGMLLDTKRIIHSSGNVRIDSIDKEGIINSDTGKRTHRLKIIKRILSRDLAE